MLVYEKNKTCKYTKISTIICDISLFFIKLILFISINVRLPKCFIFRNSYRCIECMKKIFFKVYNIWNILCIEKSISFFLSKDETTLKVSVKKMLKKSKFFIY